MGCNPFKPYKPIPRFLRIPILLAWLKRTFPSQKHQQTSPSSSSPSSSSPSFEYEEEEEEERLCFRDSQLEKYESTYKYLAARKQQQRQRDDIGGRGVDLAENCSANRTDIVGDNLWLWSGFEGAK